MAIMIKVPTIKTGWESLVKRIMNTGVEIKDERGSDYEGNSKYHC